MTIVIVRAFLSCLAWLAKEAAVRACKGLGHLGHFLLSLWRGPSTSCGSARFATMRELRRAGALADDGIILAKSGDELVRYTNPEGSILVFAPQGSGKGVGPVISNLLDYRGSVIVTDPKGENCAVTRRRRAQLGPVHVLDLGNPWESDHFNPMDFIRIDRVEHSIDDARYLADMMLVPDPKEEQHWRKRAMQWLTGVLLYVAYTCHATPC